jgi:hypothetical protein
VGCNPGGLGDEDFGDVVADELGPGTGLEVSTAGVFASPFPCVAAAVVTNCVAEKSVFLSSCAGAFLSPKKPAGWVKKAFPQRIPTRTWILPKKI